MRIDCYELAKTLKENGCQKAFITDLLRKHFGLDRTTADYVCQIPDKDWKIITRRNYKYARMKTRTLLRQGMNEWEFVDLVSGTFRISSHDVHTMLKEITLYERENESVETIEARISCFVNLLNEQPHDREIIKKSGFAQCWYKTLISSRKTLYNARFFLDSEPILPTDPLFPIPHQVGS